MGESLKREKMKFSKKYMIILIFLFILLLLLIVYPEKTVNQYEIDNSVNRALIFMNKSYSKEYIFDDAYIKCEVGLPGCDVNYRKIDVATVLIFFLPEELKNNPLISTSIRDSKKIMSEQLQEWKKTPLEPGSIPLDLYSVFVYFYPNETEGMLDNIIKKMRQDGSWEDYDMYETGYEWRKPADESWPILALAKNRVDWSILKRPIELKKYEGEMIMNGTWGWNKTGQYYGVLGIYHAFIWVRKDYDMSNYTTFIKRMEEFLSKQPEDEYLSKSTIYTADTFYWLCQGNYSNKELFDSLARTILDRQENDGSWRVNTYRIGEKTPSGTIITKELYDAGRIHTTLMSILALECYKDHYFMKS